MITFNLTKEEAQIVLTSLSNMPYREVAGLLEKLLGQANTQTAESDEGVTET